MLLTCAPEVKCNLVIRCNARVNWRELGSGIALTSTIDVHDRLFPRFGTFATNAFHLFRQLGGDPLLQCEQQAVQALVLRIYGRSAADTMMRRHSTHRHPWDMSRLQIENKLQDSVRRDPKI